MNVALYQLQPEDWHRLWLMYLSFEPKAAYQGLPPATPLLIRDWLQTLQRENASQFVLEGNDWIIGHSMLCAGPKPKEAEVAIFIHQRYRGRGLGRTLLLCTLNYGCKQLGLTRVWLSVQGANPHARHLFASVGFRPVGTEDPFALELIMERPLHCEQCRGEACAIFNETLPRIIHGQRQKKGH